jgi:prepilin-type N-terminal cleavage/methylation domain-containing protein
MKPDRPRRNGFSFLELMIVLVLISILSAIGFVNLMKGRLNSTLRSDAIEIKADFELALSYAKTGSGNARLEWSAPSNASPGYQVKDVNGIIKKIKVFDKRICGDFSGLTGSYLEFYSDGTGNNGGNVIVKTNGGTNKYFTISITKATGMVKLTENN